MDSSPILRQQSQSKILSDFHRMTNEDNIEKAEPKLSKVMSSLHLSSKHGENKNPAESIRKPLLQQVGSRLPVLAKSLKLQVPSEFKQSYNKWEEKPLAGKTKKPCTRPVPFNLSQPKNTRKALGNCEPLMAFQSRARTKEREHSVYKKPNNHPGLVKNGSDSARGSGKPHAKATSNPAHLSGKLRPTSQTSAPSNNPLFTSRKMGNKNASISSARAGLHPEIGSNPLGGKETASLTKQDTNSKPLNEESENFQQDHAALLSILRNEGIGHVSQPVVTSQNSKKCNDRPQRVSVMKSHRKVGATAEKSEKVQPHQAALNALQNEAVGRVDQPVTTPKNDLPQRVSIMKSQRKAGATAGPARVVQFSPDPHALRSVLQNEGVEVTAPLGATPRLSVCPPGRVPSIYSAQRVPLKKGCPNSTSHAVGPGRVVQFSPDPAALRSILQNEGVKVSAPVGATPRISARPPGRGTSIYSAQRVPVKKGYPESSSRSVAAQRGVAQKKCSQQMVHNIKHQPMSATVVQRLFVDAEDEQSTAGTDENPSIEIERIPAPSSPSEPLCEGKAERCNQDDCEEEEEEEEELKTFLQAPHRKSVIIFSTGKKLIRASQFENQEGSDQPAPAPSSLAKLTTATGDLSELPHQIHSAVRCLHKGVFNKPCSLSPAVAMLRKRLPHIAELRLDQEVETYTSASVPAVSPLPRCGNPLASVFQLKDSMRFIPIDLDLSSGPLLFSSSQHER
ncbi:PREDICTED: uncharacterized protein LOC107095149 [Cyprinodon variegatus]|uniref:uncharacterized protein LOC107095149 n=1 Tax=Cyprinodon variegatus TaxID=28743 RepID=UPI0007426BBC|nr:PREDICTED: uncharacterized protein LOC107095149 [Cyprinodon variegatus]XP_015246612.1 PREDICTED: uncharacterized protein LOC107095149 [Cyprinodon variegatus]